MCLGEPALVVDVDPALATATVSDHGRLRRALTLGRDDVAPGDWVLVAAGAVVRRLEAAEAADLTRELDRARAADLTRELDRARAADLTRELDDARAVAALPSDPSRGAVP